MVSIHDLLTEMQSFLSVNIALLNEAKRSKINEKNNAEFRQLVNDWRNGRYDEDPDYVVVEIGYILRRNMKA